MKLNWGTGIAFVYSAFALVMIAFVLRSRQYDPGLVSKDYYNLDLNYQERLQKKQNAAQLPESPKVWYDAARQAILLQFPAIAGVPAGSVKCFRSASVTDDLNLEVSTGTDGLMAIPAEHLTQGVWHLEVDWKAANGTPYFNETTVMIPHT